MEATLAFATLDPHRLLDAVDDAGWSTDGHLSALNSFENRVYSVGLEDGCFVVAKFYRPGRWSDAAILEEHAFCQALAERDIPAVVPLAGRKGQTLFHAGPFRLAVYPRVGGRAPELDDREQLRVIGRTVGRMHLVGATACFNERVDISVERLGDEPVEYLLDSPLLPDHLVDAYESLTEELLDILDERFSEAAGARQICLHGDFHPGNLLIAGDGTPRLLDFDDAATGPAIQDLWMFISGDRNYAEARLAELLDGYEEFRPFDHRELSLIEPLRTLRIIHHASWIARRWNDPAFQLAFPQFGDGRYFDEHLLALREQRAALDEPVLGS